MSAAHRRRASPIPERAHLQPTRPAAHRLKQRPRPRSHHHARQGPDWPRPRAMANGGGWRGFEQRLPKVTVSDFGDSRGCSTHVRARRWAGVQPVQRFPNMDAWMYWRARHCIRGSTEAVTGQRHHPGSVLLENNALRELPPNCYGPPIVTPQEEGKRPEPCHGALSRLGMRLHGLGTGLLIDEISANRRAARRYPRCLPTALGLRSQLSQIAEGEAGGRDLLVDGELVGGRRVGDVRVSLHQGPLGHGRVIAG